MMMTLQLKVKDTLKFQTMMAYHGEAYVMIILGLQMLMFFAEWLDFPQVSSSFMLVFGPC